MNFPQKLVATIVVGLSIAFAPLGTHRVLGEALDQKEIRELAKNISVKIVESNSSSNGSGVIFNRKKDIYSVLTNQHVAGYKGNYEIHTPDGLKHPISFKEEIPGLDLMVVQFKSKNEYKVAPLGDSEEIAPLQLVYVAGFPAIQADLDIVDGKIRSIRQNVLKNPQENQGYALVYTNQTLPGSSGGAVLDERGRLIGINGEAERDFRSGRDISRGIPINLFISLSFNYLPEDEFELEEVPEEELEEYEVDEEEGEDIAEEFEEDDDDDDDEENDDIAYLPQVTGNSSYSVAHNLAQNEAEIKTVAITPNGQTVVSGDGDREIKVWHGLTGSLERTLYSRDEGVKNVLISADGNIIVSSTNDGKIHIWNRRTGNVERTLIDDDDEINSIALSLNGEIIISGGDKKIKVWNRRTGKLESILKGHEEEIKSVAVSADGNTIVSGGQDRRVKVWNWRSGELKQTLKGHKEEVRAVAISNDGRTIISGSGDKTIKVWDTAGQLKHTLRGHTGKVDSLVLTSNGNTIVSGSRDRTIKIWNVSSGTLEQSLTTERSDAIRSIAASANEEVVVSAGEENSSAIWHRQP